MGTFDINDLSGRIIALFWTVVIGLIVAAIVYYLFCLGTDALFNFLLGQKKHTLSSRRRILRSKILRTSQEERFDEMDDEALHAYLEEHPGDAMACEIHCERLRLAGRWADYARELRYLIARPGDQMSVEERCRRHHELADLYLEAMGRPDQAIEILQSLTDHFPLHYQAVLARRRLKELADAPDSDCNSDILPASFK